MKKVVEKPWGCEVIWAKNNRYVGKLLYINSGHKLSLQYHEKKVESFIVTQGRIKFHWFEDGETVPKIEVMVPGDYRDVPSGTVHRMEAIDNACIVELSTPELEDVIRLEDDYGRIK